MNINLQAIPMEENETVTLRSSVFPAVMRRTLWRGTLLGGIGVIVLMAGGIFIPVREMIKWGPFLFLGSLALMTWGLIPYRRLKRLEENPNILTIDGKDWLHFSAKGKPLFSIPMVSIDHLAYIDKENTYGIGVFLKHPLPKKLVIQSTGFNLAAFRGDAYNLPPCDLFLSYFSRRNFTTLQEHLND